MQNSALAKLLAALMVLIIVLGIVWHFLIPVAPKKSSDSVSPAPTNHFKPPQFVVHPYRPPAVEQPELDATGQPKISREKVEEWLTKHNRNAMSLLAAFRAFGDTNYLNEAATNFPNNPQVELAVLAHDEFPQDRRKWLDLFKNSSPSNSLANYLSAQDYFKNGKSDEAIRELSAASGKSQFDSFQTESRLDSEDLYLSSGYSQLDSTREGMTAMSDDLLPELSAFKQLSIGLKDLQKQYLAAGDAASTANLAQMGMNFGNQINSGDSGKYIINQLVGMAIEANSLSGLDQNASYDFLNGETPGQISQALKGQKASFRKLQANFSTAYPDMTESEMNSYVERTKIYGEIPAMQWVILQHPPNPAPNGP